MQEEDIYHNFSLSFSNFESLGIDFETSDRKQINKEFEKSMVELSTTIQNKSNPIISEIDLENKNMPNGLFKSEIFITNNKDFSNSKAKSDKVIRNYGSDEKQIGSSLSQIDAKSDVLYESKIPNIVLDENGKLKPNSYNIATCCRNTKYSIKR